MKVREAFQILTQGVEMVQYDHSAKGGAKKSKKIVWMVRINTIIVYYCIFECCVLLHVTLILFVLLGECRHTNIPV